MLILPYSEEENEDGVPDLPQAQESKCLLDVMSISLSSMDLRTADRLSVFTENLQKEDIVVGGFIVRQNADFKVLLQSICNFHSLFNLKATCNVNLLK